MRLANPAALERGLIFEGEDTELNLNLGRRRYPTPGEMIMHNPFFVPKAKKSKKKEKGKKKK